MIFYLWAILAFALLAYGAFKIYTMEPEIIYTDGEMYWTMMQDRKCPKTECTFPTVETTLCGKIE